MRRTTPRLRTAAAATATVGLAALAPGALAWTRPLESVSTTSTTPTRSMTFAYSAAVPKSAAYDGTTVVAPEPVSGV